MEDGSILIKAIRPAIIEYFDLCIHREVSSDDFFQNRGLHRLKTLGLVLEDDGDDTTPATVKILYIDDLEGDENSEGFVIPRSCVIKITYLTVDEDENSDTMGKDFN